MNLTIRPATPEDYDPVRAIWTESIPWFGSIGGVFNPSWYRHFHQNPAGRSHWLVAAIADPEGSDLEWDIVGFAHFTLRKDHRRTLHEIAVASAHQRSGLGAQLLNAVGRPCILKTDDSNLPSNTFYRRNGFHLSGVTQSRDGSRTLNSWESS